MAASQMGLYLNVAQVSDFAFSSFYSPTIR